MQEGLARVKEEQNAKLWVAGEATDRAWPAVDIRVIVR